MTTTNDNSGTPSLSEAVGTYVRQWRQRYPHVRQEDLVDTARVLGLDWSRSSVGELEAGRRRLSAEELLLLPHLLRSAAGGMGGTGVASMLTTAAKQANARRPRLLIGAVQVDDETITSWLSDGLGASNVKHSTPGWTDVMAKAAEHHTPGDAERKAARKLGISPTEVVDRSIAAWGVRLSAERDRRVAERAPTDASASVLRALRGHVSRQLLEELEGK